jgi:hypothetical protein
MKFKAILFFLAFVQFANSQTHHISGYVEDSQTGERIIGAYVIDSISKMATSTNNYGFYTLTNLHQQAAIYATYVGFSSEVRHIALVRDTTLLFKIYPVSKLNEVVIKSTQYNHTINSPLGLSIIPVKTLTLIPALGEPDLLKSIQSQPGIKGGIEGSAGLFVRGGGGGENLIMLDDVPLYNVSHLYGFFSVFNSNAIKDVKLFKGCFPARYGGRTSSVIDVRSLDGNTKSLKGEASIGLISSSFTLNGPLLSDKTTFIVSGRRAYFDVLTKPFKKLGIVDKSFPYYYFYDLNARLAHTFSQSDRIFVSFYKGKDNIRTTNNNSETTVSSKTFSEIRKESSGWGNFVSSLRWNHTFGNNIFSNSTFAYSRYDYFTQNQYNSTDNNNNTNTTVAQNYVANYTSDITDLIVKTDFDYSISNNNQLRFGAGITFHTFNPGKNIYSMDDQLLKQKADTSFTNTIIHANEPYIYIEDEIKIAEKITMNGGMRVSGFVSGNNQYIYPEPRLSANYNIIPSLSLKAGYSRMVEYMHLLSSYGVSMPTDIWVPALNGLKPLQSDQVNMGISYDFNKTVLISAEVYRKWLYNTTDYQNGVSLTTDFIPWYNKVTQGNGNTKGVELSIEKQTGPLTGSISYTFSISDRNYDELNNGITFPFIYDRRHDFNISGNYKISGKWDISALWFFGTGYPVTLPTEKYLPALGISGSDNNGNYFGQQIDYYPSPNNSRLPAYHRLDLSLHYNNHNRWGKYTWSFDIFNAYNRKNPIYMYYIDTSIKYANLLPIIPSVTYTLRF